MQTNKSGGGSVFGAIGGFSQSIRSVKEMLGNNTEGTSQVLRSESKQSKRSKMDKSHQSKRGLRSGIVQRTGKGQSRFSSYSFNQPTDRVLV